MFTFLVILTIVSFAGLMLANGVKLEYSQYSLAELKRRAKRSAASKAELARELSLPAIKVLFSIKIALLIVFTVVLLIVTFGWALGICLAIVVALIYSPASHTKKVTELATVLYNKLEPKYLVFIAKFPALFKALGNSPLKGEPKVHSREEFQELIEGSYDALTDIERKVIANALTFNDRPVSDIMTPKSVIDVIKKGEFLGPLVLDELHGLGHSRLPVIDEDLDHVVGILYLRDLLSLDIRRSATAEKVMDTHIYYIREDYTLEHALAAFLKNRHHMFIVINKYRETVGILTIEDTIEALLGRKIIDEDDNHADMQSVAQHKSIHNNIPTGYVDV